MEKPLETAWVWPTSWVEPGFRESPGRENCITRLMETQIGCPPVDSVRERARKGTMAFANTLSERKLPLQHLIQCQTTQFLLICSCCPSTGAQRE